MKTAIRKPFKPMRWNDDDVRRAWYGPESADAIAERYGVTAITVRRFWNAEKAADPERLPRDDQRPHFAKQAGGEWFDGIDSPKAMHEKNRASCDASLAALRAAHGDDPPVLHVMPAAFLAAETIVKPGALDPGAHEIVARLILPHLKGFFRLRDKMVRALLNKRNKRLADVR